VSGKFPSKKLGFFNFCLVGLKNLVRSGRKMPRPSPYFMAGLKFARVRSRPVSTTDVAWCYLVMGPGLKIFTWVGSIFCGSGQVGSVIWGLGLNFKNFPLKCQIFQFFSLRIKKNCFGSGRKVPGSKPGRHLIYCGSKASSEARVGSGPISRATNSTSIRS